MIPRKPMAFKATLTALFFIIFSVNNIGFSQDGALIFRAKCASCHIMGQDATGPNLEKVLDRWDGNVDHVKQWILNFNKAVAAGIPRAVEVVNLYSGSMQVFEGSMNDAELDAVIKYINEWKPPAPVVGDNGDPKQGNSNAVIFAVISLILGIIALILMQVNSNLKKMSDDVEGIRRPEPVPFYKNKVYIAMFALLCFAVMGFYFSKAAIGFQRQKNYQPVQPIFYSHKVHAGINQISCLYCHGAAWESKHAAIPSVNVCMNCHKTITEYSSASPKLYDGNGEIVDGTAEIQKLYKYAGFDPKKPSEWDPSNAKPIEWVKIHNLPDHVFFDHSQHIRVGNVQCQTCHGEITAMDEVKQESELSLGWCVNCHRETKIAFNYSEAKGNKFYSIYEKFHNDIKAGKMDSVTVKDIGGLECQKCHY
jgi:cytochrome c551/c552